MYNRPIVIGVRQSDKAASKENAAAAVLALGRNTGNMMFTESLTKVLDGARWGSFGFTPEELADRDAIVLASANWINNFEDFGWLADRLEPVQLPVFLVGVGAQSSLEMEIPSISAGTRRLLDLVRDRSTSIAARGRFTCEVLEKLGVKSVVETGCPSLLLAGAQGPKLEIGYMSRESCAVHSTRHGFQATDNFQSWLYQQAFKQKLDLVLQSELSDIYLALGSEEAEQIPEKGVAALSNTYGTADMGALRQYLQAHGHVFLNYSDWINFMSSKTLCFGTRIHGTIAALIAGVPSTLICHDSRTLEMAHSMAIPHTVSTAIDTSRDLQLTDLFLPEETLNFVSGYKQYFARFMRYFHANGLATSAGYSVH